MSWLQHFYEPFRRDHGKVKEELEEKIGGLDHLQAVEFVSIYMSLNIKFVFIA